jgi:predicted metal-dependent HD superfamily phosphohydrolase
MIDLPQGAAATDDATAANPSLGLIAALPWDTIEAVAIETTANGPWAEDVFWVLAPKGAVAADDISLPGGWIQGNALDALLARLPGLDLARLVWAMASAQPRTFCLWRRDRSPQQADQDGLVERFAALVARAGGDAEAAVALGRALLASWSEPARRYHDRQHLCDCLFELDALRAADAPDVTDLAAAPAVELALWYHDAVYDTQLHDSEERSAQRLVADLGGVGVDALVVAAAARLVRATAHLSRPAGMALAADEALVVDIDLSILGQHRMRFADFEDGIGEEYAAVPKVALRWKRGRFLRGLLASPEIFATPTMRARREAAARANLRALLAQHRYAWWGLWL